MREGSRLLEREISQAITAPVRNAAGPVLREIIDYGIAAFERCSASAQGLDTPIGALFPYLLFFELLDGTEALLDAAAVVPAKVVLRSAFEALLSFEYVAKDDTDRRGAAYLVAEVHRRLSEIDRFDPATDRGRQFAAMIRKDALGHAIDIPTVDDAAERRTGLQSLLARPHLAVAAAEYARTKELMSKTPPFHALWNGPATLEQLAVHLGRSGLYEILYRSWSKTSHGIDLGRQLRALEHTPAISRFRSGEDLNSIYFFAMTFGLDAARKLLSLYRPEELQPAFRNWYVEKVKPTYVRLLPDEAAPEQVAL